MAPDIAKWTSGTYRVQAPMQETRTEGKHGPRESRGVTQSEDVLKITEPTTGRSTRSFGDSLLPAP